MKKEKKKYKICVYAISKNEEKFVDRWYDSIKDEADEIVVLDTGSTDNTVKKLKQKEKIKVYQKEITPWRFDDARNESLKLISKDIDICICLDLDEVIEPKWSEKINKIWKDETTRLSYIYNWHFDEYGKADITFYADKIHLRKGYKWIYPVHEVLEYDRKETRLITEEIIINHYPDQNKSRGSYLNLLELAIKENPNNDRNMHYLGREYMYYGMWNKAIDTLIKHLSLKSAVWKDERCASMRFISRCYQNLNRIDEAKLWLDKAIKEAPYLRDPYLERALLEYKENNWKEVEYYCLKALNITKKENSYINEIFSWNYTIYDLLSLSYYFQNEKYLALKYIDKALIMDPNNKRLLENKTIMEKL